MTRKKLQALKRQATKHLLLGIALFIVATLPVILIPNTDHTGSVFCWLIAGMVVYDSIKRLYILNTRG